ncbi:MAG: hypothetical protein HY319_27970 [Armatimonadetes bacterium]|nr:hypothetical protein [Armatimonadota bacterium]
MSTRTTIRFGSILEAIRKEKLPQFEPFLHEITHSNLLYGYRLGLPSGYYGFILVQASRQFGRLACEVAVSRDDSFPYHRFYDRPRLGVIGFRERVYRLNRGRDELTRYAGPEKLSDVLMHLVGVDAEVALGRLHELVLPIAEKEVDCWLPLYRDWLLAERGPLGEEPGFRYHNLAAEPAAHDFLHETLLNGSFDRYLGPLKFRYRDPNFMNCHIYLLARSLDFLEAPPPGEQTPAEREVEDGPLADAIPALTGRSPQVESITWASSPAVSVMQYALLKSLSAVQACFSPEAPEWQPLPEIREPREEPPPPVSPPDMLYDGIYDPCDYAEATEAPVPPQTPEAAPDPFDTLGERLQPSKRPRDPFEMLGEALEA